MPRQIETIFDKELNAFIVSMPEFITLAALKDWREKFLSLLPKLDTSEKVALLLDTNRHDFETIGCLRLLRELLSNDCRVKKTISRVAFVQPRRYREPEIISSIEAYFSQVTEAYEWIRQ